MSKLYMLYYVLYIYIYLDINCSLFLFNIPMENTIKNCSSSYK